MGRNSYLGGGTIIHRGTWGSYDPAESRSGDVVRKKSKKSKKTVVKFKKTIGNLGKQKMLRESFLYSVTSAQVYNRNLPGIPKKLSTKTKNEIRKCSSLIEWAKTQESYDEYLSEAQKKKNNRFLASSRIIISKQK